MIAMVSGGTLVPLIYTIYQRHKSKSVDDMRAAVEIEEIASRAATEAVVATKGALDILRQQVADGHELRKRDEETIKQLRRELADLRCPPDDATVVPPP